MGKKEKERRLKKKKETRGKKKNIICVIHVQTERANQIFTKIDKLPSNANTTSHWYSAGVVQSLHGRDACLSSTMERRTFINIYNMHIYKYIYIYTYYIMSCVEQ